MKKRLSLKVLVSLILFTLIPGILVIGLAEWLTERIVIDYFLQRGIELAWHINEEFYAHYFNPLYEVEGNTIIPLAPDSLKKLNRLIQDNVSSFQLERVNFFSQTGQVIYSTEKELVGMDALAVPQLQRAIRGEVVSRVVPGFRGDPLHAKAGTTLPHDVIEVYLPMLCLNTGLSIYGQQVGVIEIYQNVDVVHQWISRIRLCMGGMLLLNLVVLIVTAFSVLHRTALKPLAQLVKFARRIGEGDLATPVSLAGEDELGRLADSLDQMWARLAGSFGELEGRQQQMAAAYEQEKKLKGQLQLLHDFAMAISSDLSLQAVLQRVVDKARELCGAQYAALAVVDASAELKEFLTAGITPGQRAAMRPLPQYRYGLLGCMLRERKLVSLRNILEDPRSVGFPPHHPPMSSFLGIPIVSRDKVVGVLYLTDKIGAEEFSPEDSELLERFAAHAAIAIENAMFHGQVEERARELSRQIAAQSQYARVVLRSIADGVYSTDLERRIQSWSRGAEAITGFAEEQVLGRRCQDFLCHHDKEGKVLCDTECPISNALRRGEQVAIPEVWVHTRDEREVPLSVMVAPIFGAQDGVIGAVEVFHDISWERELREGIQRADQTKSEFLANMSHELRTPLNAIIGYSEMLQEEAEDLDAEDFVSDLQKINAAGRHLLTLVNDILDLSKVEAGKMDLYLEVFDIVPLVQDVVTTLHPLAEKNGNALEVRCADDLGSMRADVTKVRQVLLNLLNNACKFTERGTITLDAARETSDGVDGIVFGVTDTGIGMAPEQMERLFQAFSQADQGITRKYGGTGLGLVLSQRFCRMMGGEITVESALGRGSTFTVRLPANVVNRGAESVPAAQEPGSQDPPAPEGASTARVRLNT